MKTKTLKYCYVTLVTLFATMMFADGLGGIFRAEAGQVVLRHLGYPVYLLTICGIAKVLGAIAIAQNRYHVVKEWAFSGFTINFIGAAMSRFFAGDSTGEIVAPLVALVFMFGVYYVWKRYEHATERSFVTLLAGI